MYEIVVWSERPRSSTKTDIVISTVVVLWYNNV